MSIVSITRTTTPEFGDFVFQVGAGFMDSGYRRSKQSQAQGIYRRDLDDDRLKLAKELGATITLNPSKWMWSKK